MRVRGLKPVASVPLRNPQKSHPMRVRGLKPSLPLRTRKPVLSHPMRVRGLKHTRKDPRTERAKSHPMRVRGLKLFFVTSVLSLYVAPHAGAWIETTLQFTHRQDLTVAPHAGAWIETFNNDSIVSNISSHPMRVRGLKH